MRPKAQSYLATRSEADHEDLTRLAREHTKADLDGVVVYAPCLDREGIERRLGRPRYFRRATNAIFAKWEGNTPSPAKLATLRPEDQPTAESLIARVSSEQAFAQQCVSLLALHEQRACIC